MKQKKETLDVQRAVLALVGGQQNTNCIWMFGGVRCGRDEQVLGRANLLGLPLLIPYP